MSNSYQPNTSFILKAVEDVVYEDRPVPECKFTPRHNEVLVEVKKTVGSKVKNLKPGDQVALEPGQSCATCEYCKSGRYHLCADMVFAATPPYDGTLARYYKLRSDIAYKLPPNMSLEDGAMIEPTAVAVHSVSTLAKFQPEQSIAVFGAGPVGILCMAVAKALGARRIVAIDIAPHRLEFAKNYAATDAFLPPKMEEGESKPAYSARAAALLKKEFGLSDRGDNSVDVVIDASGAEVCVQMGFHIIRVGGTYVQVGMGPDAQVPFGVMMVKELTVRGSFRYGPGDYQLAIALVSQGKVDLKPLVTHRFEFTDAVAAFNTTKTGKGPDGKGVIKAIINGPNANDRPYDRRAVVFRNKSLFEEFHTSIMLSRSVLRTGTRLASHRTIHSSTRSVRSSNFYATAATAALLVSAAFAFAQPLQLDADPSRGQKKSGSARAKTQTPQTENLISYDEVQKHNTRESCWVVIRGLIKVYDPDLLNYREIYESIHAKGLIEKMLKPSQHIGALDPSTAPAPNPEIEVEEERIANARAKLPPLSHVLNLNEFEELAETVLSKTAWSYYRSAADDEYGGSRIAHMNNALAFRRYWFRPRVLRGTKTVDTSCEILGVQSALPIFVSPAAMAGLGNPAGEVNITKGAGKTAKISSNASCTIDEIAAARTDPEKQPLFFQLYVASDRAKSVQTIKRVEELGYRAIFFTVDAPVLGNRELDQRNRSGLLDAGDDDEEGQKGGVASTIDGYFDADIDWSTLKWLKTVTKLPIILKGVQTVEDVELAAEHGVQAVLLSNHGGRQLDYAPAGIDVLYELRQKRPDLFDKVEVYVDGGVRRGTDVLKALCLGAKGVGLGRTFLFANGTYGEKGVVKAVRILRNEIETGMRLLGATSLDQLRPEMVERAPFVEIPSGLYRSIKSVSYEGLVAFVNHENAFACQRAASRNQGSTCSNPELCRSRGLQISSESDVAIARLGLDRVHVTHRSGSIPVFHDALFDSFRLCFVSSSCPGGPNEVPPCCQCKRHHRSQWFANVLEQLETEFYKQALAKFKESDFTAAGFVSASVPVEQFNSIATDEATHTSTLASVLRSLGQEPVSGCNFDFNPALADVKTMAAVARLVENVGVSAYLGGAALIDDRQILVAAGTILTDEARHQTVLNMLNGGVAIPAAFDVALAPSQVLAIAGGFISGCDLGIPANPVLKVTNTGAVAPGTTLTFDSPALAGLDRATLSCQMMTGGVASAAVFPIDQCVVPQGLEGPVYIYITNSTQPLLNSQQNQNVASIVAGPTGAFIDTRQESASSLFKSGGQLNSGSTTSTITPEQASQIAGGGQAG
ncbi:cytochrome b2 (L-lactate ferricytochrome C oxidoreductase) [Rhizoctonia solani AG-1 IA]|uniref:L-lactate dehydrogenase (cytochrome) n=1 Tax=Thanatephorus cucumeris (strain AG1-IA) TaxID=983506 RepID=L8X677_THACA|nr:cytochrome b2 (L-lactate ferricytochrome C oxidoreductase) [Rhizoctonia solani AG-1 IA]